MLSYVLFLPLLGAFTLLFVFVPPEQHTAHRMISIVVAWLVFFLSLPLMTGFDASSAAFQFAENHAWIESIGAGWNLGVDGISLWIVMLTTFLTPLILMGSTTAITKRTREFAINMLVLETAMLGALMATDLLLFYLFWETDAGSDVLHALVGIWGGKNHVCTLRP